jgi:uncharacterized membrane protein
MSNLIVVGFKRDMYRASEVLNELSALDFDWTVDLRDAVAVYRDYSGKLRVDQSYQMTTGEGAAWGGLWGSLIGLTLAIPVAVVAGPAAPVAAGALAVGTLGGTAVGAASGAIDADWWKDSYGIPEDFVKEVGEMVQPGDSAIYALLHSVDPTYVAEQFRGYGGTVLWSTLTYEQDKKIEAVLDGRR